MSSFCLRMTLSNKATGIYLYVHRLLFFVVDPLLFCSVVKKDMTYAQHLGNVMYWGSTHYDLGLVFVLKHHFLKNTQPLARSICHHTP